MDNLIKISLLTFVFLFFLKHGQAQSINNAGDAKKTILITGTGIGELGTGLYFIAKSKLFLITAKHVLFNLKKTTPDGMYPVRDKSIYLISYSEDVVNNPRDTILVDLSQALENGGLHHHKEKDIAVVFLGNINPDKEHSVQFLRYIRNNKRPNQISVFQKDQTRSLDQITLGNDVFIYGFPTSLDLSKLKGSTREAVYEFNRPLIRSGIISGISKELNSIIVDGAVFYGNSGGPVIEKKIEYLKGGSFLTITYRLIGIATEFIPFYFPKSKEVDISNSGFTVVVPIIHALELIDKYYN
jgi:hypothetical protein